MKKLSILCLLVLMALVSARCGSEKETEADYICKNLSSVRIEDTSLSDFTQSEDNGKMYRFADILLNANSKLGTVTVTEDNLEFEGLLIQTAFVKDAESFALNALASLNFSEDNILTIKEKLLLDYRFDVYLTLDINGYRVTSVSKLDDNGTAYVFMIVSAKEVSAYTEGAYKETPI